MLVGVISDTHGIGRPEAVAALTGVEIILHAGDIGNQAVLDALRDLAPVVAIRGNNDKGRWADLIPDWEVIEAGEVSIYMLHDLKEIDINPAGQFQVVVSGHSHKPVVEEKRGVLYLNPGSAGPRRFTLPVSVAHLHIGPDTLRAELIELVV